MAQGKFLEAKMATRSFRRALALVLIGVSVDPVTDTPARLRAWGDMFRAGPGWTLWTGEKSQIDKLLKGLQVFAPDFADHSSIVLIFDGRGAVTRINGLSDPKLILQAVDAGG